MSAYHYRCRTGLIPWKDEEGFDRYFSEEMGKFKHFTTEQVMEYDRSMRKAAHDAYLSEREADPSLPIRYPTMDGKIEDDAADDFGDPDEEEILQMMDPEDLIGPDGRRIGWEDSEEIIGLEEIIDPGVITEGSSSPNSIDYFLKGRILRRTKKNPSPHASTEGDEAANFGEAKKNPSLHVSTDAFAEEDEAATFGEAEKNLSPHASTDASAEEDEAATFGEAKKNIHFLPCDSPPDYASKFKRMRNEKKKDDEQKQELPL